MVPRNFWIFVSFMQRMEGIFFTADFVMEDIL